MGWYTNGPGGLNYKYGDVFDLGFFSRLGTCSVTAKITPIPYGGGEYYYEELIFLDEYQSAISKANLPWEPFNLDKTGYLHVYDESNVRKIKFYHNRPIKKMQTEIKNKILSNIHSIEQYINQTNYFGDALKKPIKIKKIDAELQYKWSLERKDWDRLAEYISDDGSKRFKQPLSTDIISSGYIDDNDWYHLPKEFEDEMLSYIEDSDDTNLALQALGHAVLADDELVLYESGEPWQFSFSTKTRKTANAI